MMETLINVKNNEAVTTSLLVAEKFHKRHDSVLRTIENLTINLPKNVVVKFYESTYKDAKGEQRKMYYMNRDGFSLLVMGFTGQKALEWKLDYIKAFNTMESILSERKSDAWIETRRYGKLTRKSETDVIKQLIEYAKEQGSTHSEMLYMTYTKLANKIAGVSDRDFATIRQLNNLDLIESIILGQIEKGMIRNLDYHEIYQECKQMVVHFGEFTNISRPMLQAQKG